MLSLAFKHRLGIIRKKVHLLFVVEGARVDLAAGKFISVLLQQVIRQPVLQRAMVQIVDAELLVRHRPSAPPDGAMQERQLNPRLNVLEVQMRVVWVWWQ